MGIKRTILPLLIFGGGFAGTVGGLLLQWYCNAYRWGWNISGKPTWSIPANIPIAFETTILLSVFTTFFGMWMMNKLPQVWHPLFRSDRFNKVTDDSFFLGIESKDRRFDVETTAKLLKDAGALEVENVYLDPDPAKKRLPKWLFAFIVSSTAFALVPLVIAAKARNSKSSEPHIHIFPDMDFQPKYKSDQAMDLFADERENRGEIDGTVSRDPASLKADEAFYYGLDSGAWITGFPKQLDIDQRLMDRGKSRFNIYCTPCHGYDGQGMGAVPTRVARGGGTWAVRDLTDSGKVPSKAVITMPNGQLFNTISNGYSTMMGYAAQIPHRDRWAIVLYVRALERAHNAALDDVPTDQRGNIR
jgi:mono/diheme cytochrome c family protein